MLGISMRAEYTFASCCYVVSEQFVYRRPVLAPLLRLLRSSGPRSNMATLGVRARLPPQRLGTVSSVVQILGKPQGRTHRAPPEALQRHPAGRCLRCSTHLSCQLRTRVSRRVRNPSERLNSNVPPSSMPASETSTTPLFADSASTVRLFPT